MQFNPISLSVFLMGIFLGIIAFFAWQHRETRGSRIFGLFMGLITLYVLGYSMELSSLDLKTMLFWSTVEYIGIFSFPNIFLLFVFQYTDRDRWITKKNICFLFIIPIILLFFKITDGIWHLVYATTWVDMTGMIPLLGFTRGPVYLLASYNAFPVILGVVLLLRQQKYNQKLYRNQTKIILISVIPPLLVFFFYLIGFQPFPRLKYLDLNAFSYPLWGMGFYWAAYRYKLFQLAPIARETLIEHLSDGVLVFDDQNRLVDANPMAQRMMGWDQSPLGQDACQLFLNWEELMGACRASGMVETVKFEMQHWVNGRRFNFDLDITPLKDKKRDTVGKLIVIHDITDQKQLEEKLMGMTLIDELTGLNNRRGFLVLAAQFIQMVNRMNLNAVVIFLDVDQMKMINDTFGHAEGDRALFEAANLLRSTMRASDILARYGGDEFVALVMETESNGSDVMLTRLDKKFAEFNAQENRKYPMTLSYGVARYNSARPESLDELIEKADRAMYEQKQAKKRNKTVE